MTMTLDELLAEPTNLKFLRTWREQAYQRGIKRLEDHMKYHHCNEPQMGYCSIYPGLESQLVREIEEYDDKINEYLSVETLKNEKRKS
jgi:hypothetical protein